MKKIWGWDIRVRVLHFFPLFFLIIYLTSSNVIVLSFRSWNTGERYQTIYLSFPSLISSLLRNINPQINILTSFMHLLSNNQINIYFLFRSRTKFMHFLYRFLFLTHCLVIWREREHKVVTKVKKRPPLRRGRVSPHLPVPDHIPRPPYVGSDILPEIASEHQIHDSEGIAKMRAACELAARVLNFAGTLVRVKFLVLAYFLCHLFGYVIFFYPMYIFLAR